MLLAVSGLFGELRWRNIGPYRGGRTKAAVGVAGRPGLYYVGAVDGGVWRTDDFGRTWSPIFDEQPTGSIGAIAVASPDVIYVASGEGMQRPDLSTGDGIYKSADGGKTWAHLGLRDGQQIPQMAVDPRDPNRLFVAVLGHPYGLNEERGVFRSLDGGATFEKVLYRDPDTGAADVALDPSDPRTVYASLWESREGPWENGHFSGPGSGLYKSTDGGTTWRRLEKGLPDNENDKLNRIGIGVAPSNPKRIFLSVGAKKNPGIYRSDDAGESWSLVSADERLWERADDSAEVKVDPRNPDVVYVASVVTWKSTDGGKTFAALRGAPGGDDYQRLWIDPTNPDVILLASDQGAIVSVNGGATWSSWYNQPTAQMFHATADNAFPYRVCGGQQDSGSACVSSRGTDGAVTFRDWRPAGFEEYGYAAPDPLDPDIVFGGKVSRWDRRTGQGQDVAPVAGGRSDYRAVRTQPLVFSPTDPHTLYFAANTMWKTRDGGRHWNEISPDLTRKTWDVPENVGKYRGSDEAKPEQRGVIYAIAPSPADERTIWAGTDDGLIHVTRDGGKTWRDVTPAGVGPWAKVSIMDASHFDAQTAYAAINTLRLDDLRPHIYRTHDGGKTWFHAVNGLPDGGIVNVVREDPRRKGLLYAGTEQAVYVSFDDGDSWQPLRLNMPATSIRDLVVKDSDLIAATHGRGFWILDDVEPLRQDFVGAPVKLLRLQQAWRVRWNQNTDTPLPPDEPTGKNPPDGAIIDYWLARAAGPVTLEISDEQGRLVRRFSSEDRPGPIRDEGNVPRWWIRPAPQLSAQAGLHRFVWDLHWPPPAALEPEYPIAAVPHDTPREPRGPWALPGKYTVTLSAGGEKQKQSLAVALDPHVKTAPLGLRQQFDLSFRLAQSMQQTFDALAELRAMRAKGVAPAVEEKLAGFEGAKPVRFAKDREPPPTLVVWHGRLTRLYLDIQASDLTPTPQLAAAAELRIRQAAQLVARWKKFRAEATRAP